MSARWIGMAIWALVFASALLWADVIRRAATPAPKPAASPQSPVVAPVDLARLLGKEAPPPPPVTESQPVASARMQLIGVVSPLEEPESDEGVALIAIDGKPAMAYRVGMAVDGDTVLQAIEARGARLGPRGGAALVALSIAPPAAATSSLAPTMATGTSPALPVAARSLPMAPPPPMATPPQPDTGNPPPFGGPPPATAGTLIADTPARRKMPTATR